MKKFKVMLAMLLVIVMISLSVLPSFAVVAPVDSVVSNLLWSDKIDKLVWDKMGEVSADEKIPVWVWFTDIDKSNVETMVEKVTGFTKEDLLVEVNIDNDDFISALEVASAENSELARANVAEEMELYLNATKEIRKQKREQTSLYLRAKRDIISDLYINNNKRIIEELGFTKEDIKFQSQLTPSVIVELTKNEIISIAQESNVLNVGYYAESKQVLEPQEEQKDTMQVDAVYRQTALTGKQVNVLLNEQNYVRSDAGGEGFAQIKYPSNIKVVIDGEEYSPYDYDVMPSSNNSHATYVASIIQDFAKDVYIYSTGNNRYSDIEWVLQNCDIDLINASICYSIETSKTYNLQAKWFDALVSTYDVVLIAAAGNDEAWSSINWPNIISPANSYNSIAVGAYYTNGDSSLDYMGNRRYAPVESTTVACYKPDMVIAAGSTSESTPALSAIVAMMIELEPSLSAQPEVIKAILMASCHRKVRSHETDAQELITDGLTQKQGSGAVDAYRAIKIVAEGTYGSKTATLYGLNQTATFTLSNTDDVNVSIAWSRENVNNGILDTTLGTLQELELHVYNGSNCIGSSTKTNAGKQMVYLEDLVPNTSYTIRVNKTTNNTERVTYGYAWSGKNYEQAEMTILVKTAVGQTLTADLTYVDGKTVSDEDVSYLWKSSTNGVNWQTISGANTNTYTLNSDDWNKYIRCEATLSDVTLSGDTSVNATTGKRVVLYGDANMDGSVSTTDSTTIQRYLAKLEDFTEEKRYAADVNGDNDVTGIDAIYIQQYAAKLISIFPIEE